MGKDLEHQKGRTAAWEHEVDHHNAADFRQVSNISEAKMEQLWRYVVRQMQGEFLGGPRNGRPDMMKTVSGQPSWRDIREANQGSIPKFAGPMPAKAKAIMAKAAANTNVATTNSATVDANVYEQLVHVAMAEAKAHKEDWAQDGSLADLDLPAPYGGNSYEGNFKCNIFINTALIRAGLMRPGIKGATPNVNDLVKDIEAIAAGGDVNPAHGLRWFDIVSASEAKAGDLIVINGHDRRDGNTNARNRNGHIELLTQVERNEDGSIKGLRAVGAGTKEAREHSVDGTTFGANDDRKSHFTPHAGCWFIRARPLPAVQ